MRLTFVCKRFPQQRDLVTRPYGRFFHLPMELARLGHQVQVQLVSHRGLPPLSYTNAGVEWSTEDIRTLGPRRLYQQLVARSLRFQPDWIIGLSDAPYGWLAQKLAERAGCRLAIDAYDDYESYMPWNYPLHFAWRRAIRKADLVTAAGPQLGKLLGSHRRKPDRAVEILPMTADPDFRPLDRQACRASLDLPEGAPLVGYVGGWGKARGMDVLLDAWSMVRATRPEAQLVVTGRPPEQVTRRPGVHALGYISDQSIPLLVNSVDIACVIGSDTRFSRSSYPSKLCEAMACGTAVAASATDPIRWMLGNERRWLSPVGSASALAACIAGNLGCGRVEYPVQPTWAQLAHAFGSMLSA